MSELTVGMGQRLLAWLPPMFVATALLLTAAALVDRLLERRVSAAARLFLYLAVLARPALPAGWHTPVGLMRSFALSAAVPGARESEGEGAWRSSWKAAAGAPAGTSRESARATSPSRPPRTAAERAVDSSIAAAYALAAIALAMMWGRRRLILFRQLLAARSAPQFRGRSVLLHPTLGPFACGFFRPRIIIPQALAGERLPLVLAHEAAHLDRGDQRLLPVIQLACILAWPLLPLWLAAARIRTLAELAADERALAGRPAEERRRYGELLVELADPHQPLPAFGSALGSRLRALAHRRRWPAPLQLGLVGALAVVLLACAAGPEPGGPVVLGVSAAGLTLDGQLVPPAQLTAALREALAAHHTHLLQIDGDPLAAGLDVLAAAKRAGAEQIQLLPSPTLVDSDRPRVAPPRSSSSPGLTLAEVIRAHQPDVKYCYRRWLAGSSGTNRRRDVVVEVNPDGKATHVEMASRIESDPTDQCLEETIARWGFPPNADRYRLAFPIIMEGGVRSVAGDRPVKPRRP